MAGDKKRHEEKDKDEVCLPKSYTDKADKVLGIFGGGIFGVGLYHQFRTGFECLLDVKLPYLSGPYLPAFTLLTTCLGIPLMYHIAYNVLPKYLFSEDKK